MTDDFLVEQACNPAPRIEEDASIRFIVLATRLGKDMLFTAILEEHEKALLGHRGSSSRLLIARAPATLESSGNGEY